MDNSNTNKSKQIAAMTIFGTIGLARRHIGLASGMVSLARGVVGALFLLVARAVVRKPVKFQNVGSNLFLLILSGVLLGSNWMCLFEAYQYTSISVATMCYYMAPVIVLILSPLLLREKITPMQGFCALVALLGMVLVSGVLETGIAGIRGILYGLAAALMYAFIIVINKRIHGVSPEDRTILQLGFSAIAMLPYVLIAEGFPTAGELGQSALLLLLVGVVHTGIAYWLYFGSIEGLPSRTVAILSYIDPIVAVILSVLLQSEPLTLLSLLGIVMVIGATCAGELLGHRQD
ncbi:MAG: EamA family transporter [Clostridia bacterium]|nr:EamA family transporter [Clostridia bacterium]